MNFTTTKSKRKLKDPASAITHFIGMLMAFFAAFPLLLKSYSGSGNSVHTASLAIFIVSMILLYAASTTYHSLDISERVNKILRKLDHAMIYVLIAGSYTPICLIVLKGKTGLILLTLVWSVAILGIVFKMCFINCPMWLSSVLYILLGWICVLAFTPIINGLSQAAFLWLLTGGIIYTIGGVIYALKLPLFNKRHAAFGTHEIFHLFVMAGSICHFIVMYSLA